jgi:hypothetical protein
MEPAILGIIFNPLAPPSSSPAPSPLVVPWFGRCVSVGGRFHSEESSAFTPAYTPYTYLQHGFSIRPKESQDSR